MRKIFRDFLGTLMVLIPAIIAGVYLASPNEYFDNSRVSYVLLIISSTVIGLSFILGIIASLLFPRNRKKRRVNVSKDRQKLWKYTERCDRDLSGEMKKIKRLVVFEKIYFLFICLFAALGFASCAALGYSGVSVIFGFAAFWAVCFKNITVTDVDEPGLVIDESFPMLRDAVTETVKLCLPEAEYGKDVHAFVVHGSEVNVISRKSSYALCIGVSAIGLLSEEQLRAEIFNKLCRIKNGDCDFSADIVTLYTKYSANAKFFSMGMLLMSLPMLTVRRRIPDFMTASSRAADLSSDKDCAELMSDAQKHAYLGAVATLKMFEYYLTELRGSADVYADSEPPFSFESDIEDGFRKALQTRENFWRELIEKELVAKNAPYPTFAVRREALGVKAGGYEVCPDTDSYAYNVERDVVKRHADKVIREGMALTYERERKSNYLEPLEFYEKYLKRLQNGEKPNLSERVDAAFAAECVGREEEARSIYDSILQEYPDNPNALFRRGLMYLSDYDERGVDMIFAAMKGNNNCINNGAQAVNDFCVKLGLEKRLEECRELSAELFDYSINKYSHAVSINKDDVYRQAALPEEAVHEIVHEIKRQCGDALESIYMVSKTYEDVTATLVFIVPTKEYDPEAWDEAYSNIFTFLDVREEHFLLDSCTEEGKYMVKVKKTPGSLVYSKDADTDKNDIGADNE